MIKKGLDISITGSPKHTIDAGKPVKHVALMAADYVGLKPKVLVQVGEAVGLGQPLLIDKRDPHVQYVSPGTGRITAINRGVRRKLQSLIIELDDGAATEIEFDIKKSQNPQSIKDVLLKSGFWSAIRTRPYDHVANSNSTPSSIFITAIDTRPLAVNPNLVIADKKQEFITGISIIQHLSQHFNQSPNGCPVYLCTAPDWPVSLYEDKLIHQVQFRGPHPAGLVGTHIHHLDPVARGKTVWHIGYQDVIAIGYLFRTGRILIERVVSLAGPAVKNPRLIKTRMGASIKQLTEDEVNPSTNHPPTKCRIISGSVLDGIEAEGAQEFLGRYHNQISIIPSSPKVQQLNWLNSIKKSMGRLNLNPTVKFTDTISTQRSAQPGAMISIEAFDRVMPLDILLNPLLRAMLVKDTLAAEKLGCLELTEEDLALSSFVCPAKQNYGAILRLNLNEIEQSG